MPAIDSVNATPPAIRRGRCSGSGSLRIRTTAITTSAIGKTVASAPIQTRTASSARPPTGPAAPSQVPIAHTTASAINPKAMPSRRCTGSMSLVAAAPRPRARTNPPSQRAPSNHSRFSPRPMPLIAVTIGDGSYAGGFGLRTVDLLPALRADVRPWLHCSFRACSRIRTHGPGFARSWIRCPSVEQHGPRIVSRGVQKRRSFQPYPQRYRVSHTNHIRHTGPGGRCDSGAHLRFRFRRRLGLLPGELAPDPARRDVPVVDGVLAGGLVEQGRAQ